MNNQQNTSTSKRTQQEQELLDIMVMLRGQEFVDENAHLILEQARALGELPEPGEFFDENGERQKLHS